MLLTLQAAARPAALIAAAALALMTLPAGASDLRLPAHTPKSYLQACAECHAPYPPALLPPASWQRLLGGLDRHFGTDASLETAQVQAISQWLATESTARSKVREAPPQDRLTRSPWFIRHHDEVPASVWALPSVKSPANCAACHNGAEQGVFSEHALKAPAGLTPAQARRWGHD